jgi:S-adenosylmethionine synthetase
MKLHDPKEETIKVAAFVKKFFNIKSEELMKETVQETQDITYTQVSMLTKNTTSMINSPY